MAMPILIPVSCTKAEEFDDGYSLIWSFLYLDIFFNTLLSLKNFYNIGVCKLLFCGAFINIRGYWSISLGPSYIIIVYLYLIYGFLITTECFNIPDLFTSYTCYNYCLGIGNCFLFRIILLYFGKSFGCT